MDKVAEEGRGMRTWRVGMVGYGWAAGAHVTALSHVPNVEVAAICTSRTDVEQGTGIDIVRDLDELLARDDIDVIDICSRSNLHAEQAIAAARAGKHLIIEKPIALSVAELRALQEAVAASGVRTCVCFEERHSAQFTATKSMLDNALIGPLHYAEVDYYHEVGPSVRQYEWNRLKIGGGSSLLSLGGAAPPCGERGVDWGGGGGGAPPWCGGGPGRWGAPPFPGPRPPGRAGPPHD